MNFVNSGNILLGVVNAVQAAQEAAGLFWAGYLIISE